jgi:two-component system nitrogen regulation response regulator GlnG
MLSAAAASPLDIPIPASSDKHDVPTLLVIDDEPSILHFFRRAFASSKLQLETASSAREGLDKVAEVQPDVIVLDVNLMDDSGLDVFRQIKHIDSRIPVIFITGQGTTATAIEAMQLGAYEYLLKPLELDELTGLVNRALEISRLMKVPAVISEGETPDDGSDVLVGRCSAMQSVYKAIGRVAAQDVTVLILGESGTGKELIARAIYHYSRRAKGPFLAINCAAIPDALLESELFGHEKGAFTGADRRRIGKFEQANGGTLFLDEIGDMSPVTQTKILRVLQGQEFERVGGNEAIVSDVRIVAATNRNLEKLVEEETFRGDLYYRLNVFTITLPPLRERGEDLPLLARHFINRFSKELNKNVHTIPDETLTLLREYSWPGNVREFQSVIKQALLQATGPVLLPEFLPESVRTPTASQGEGEHVDLSSFSNFVRQQISNGTSNLYSDCQSLLDRQLFDQVLKHTGGNLTQSAKILGITRTTLRSKLVALGLPIEKDTPTQSTK